MSVTSIEFGYQPKGRIVTAYFRWRDNDGGLDWTEEMDFDVSGNTSSSTIIACAAEWARENLDPGWSDITLGEPSCGTVTVTGRG